MADLLADAADWFKRRKTPIQRYYKDTHGRYAFRVRVNGQPFYVAAKKYLHGDQASFMSKLVDRAADADAFLMLFVMETGDRLIFHPVQARENGQPSDPTESKRQAQGEDWLDVPTDWAVDFQRWHDDGKTPTLNQSGDDAPNRPWNVTAWGDDRD